MKKYLNYSYSIDKETQEKILQENVLTNKEKEMFKSFLNNEPVELMMKKYNYKKRMITYKKSDIYRKIQNCYLPDLEEQTRDDYKVYVLYFPNGKIYVGSSKNPPKRWNNGKNYGYNDEMKQAINKYGWNNIKKYIIYSNLTYTEAKKKESETIVLYKTYIEEIGYNKSILW